MKVTIPKEDDPNWLLRALKELGVEEHRNPDKVMAYAKDAKVSGYDAPSVPWCSVFVSAMLERSNYKSTNSAWARSYLSWGSELKRPTRGCIVVLRRGHDTSTGHVGFYLGEAFGGISLLSGNTSDCVCVRTFSEDHVISYRWPHAVEAALPIKEVADGKQASGKSKTTSPAPKPAAITPDAPPAPPRLPEPTKAVQEAVEDRLRAHGSRTIISADRIHALMASALAWLGIGGLADVPSAKQHLMSIIPSGLNLGIVCWFVAGLSVAAAIYELKSIYGARVDDDQNGQQKRGNP